MKTLNQIETRLTKITNRYKRKYIEEHSSKTPNNCVYNHIHFPRESSYLRTSPKETGISPRKITTLVVFQEPQAIRICTYGSSDVKTWNGNICDSETVSKPCAFFKCHKSFQDLEAEFKENIKNDKYVAKHYKDLATLQWVSSRRLNSLDGKPKHKWKDIYIIFIELSKQLILQIFNRFKR